uniref:Uncharacterized protein n=1 Tax=Romanomermis culicivorax TaxID=13658 RepID=A0A915J797_ROMCU
MITNTENINPDKAPRKIYPVTSNKALAINLNPERHMPTASTDLQAEIVLASCNLQAFGVTSTSHPPTTPKIASGLSDKTLIEQLDRILAVQPRPHNFHKPNFQLTPMISVANAIGDHAAEDRPKEVQTTPAVHGIIFMKVILSMAQMILFMTPRPSS